MNTKLWLALAGAIAANTAAQAALPASITISADKKTVYATPTHHTAAPTQKTKRAVIFDNLAKLDPLGVYMVGTGETLSGPNSGFGQNWLAAAFTPATAATLTEVQVAVGYIQGAKSAVLINIYADASGAPGTLLWSQRAKLPVFGDCCATANAHDAAGLPLTAGTQYWVGIVTLADATDIFGAWSFNVADQVDPGLIAIDSGAGWKPSPSTPNFAFAVFGK